MNNVERIDEVREYYNSLSSAIHVRYEVNEGFQLSLAREVLGKPTLVWSKKKVHFKKGNVRVGYVLKKFAQEMQMQIGGRLICEGDGPVAEHGMICYLFLEMKMTFPVCLPHCNVPEDRACVKLADGKRLEIGSHFTAGEDSFRDSVIFAMPAGKMITSGIGA